MKTLIIVPAYNEEKSIYNVVTSIKFNIPWADVVVINDGSKDNTYLEAKKAGAKVINLIENLGIGGAVQSGYIYALKKEYDIAVQVDGDGQHNPADLNLLLREIEKGNTDMVIGSRFVEETGYKASVFRNIGIKYFSNLVSKLCGKSYYDTTSGYRLVNKKGIELFSSYYPKDYPEVETIVYACKKGLNVKEVKVNMNEREAGKSSITPIKAIYYMAKVTMSTLNVAFRSIY
ncbi:MAG: glycosyltransferase family 2 protein [Clostridium sp.]|uniref:glycosyltransferase family 2 protein n=1 Tax=Clostridium sp. TaxID=1506 RepID=UPI0029093847|nr:glycosyltransferase family 2 protein [Clostridium sp.]MDU5110199.1 glycosyltransferase family 2 protein [Clostridium sp.]